MAKDWALTREAFERLLDWLDADRERAALRYESIRRSLIKLFTWRGCHQAEEMADETINRVTQKLPRLGQTYTGDPALYFYGVARLVLLEYFRAGAPAREAPLEVEQLGDRKAAEQPDPSRHKLNCLERCLQTLGAPERELILRYYREGKQGQTDFRRGIAAQLGITLNTLRVKVHRIRGALQSCIEKCVEEGGGEEIFG